MKTETVTSKDQTSIAFTRLGGGEPLILVDGALCRRSLGPMPKLAPLLGEHFSVFMYDRRGRDESGDTAPYAVEREIEDLAALIDAAGGSASVFGISSGAVLALRAAASGLSIRRLALYEPPYMVAPESPRRTAGHAAKLREHVDAGRRGAAVHYFLKDMVGVPAPVAFFMRLTPVWPKLKAVAHTLPYDAAVMGEFTIPAGLGSRIRQPVLISGGEKSPAPLREAVNAVAEALPQAEKRMLAGQTHNVAARVLAPVLIEFFQQHGY